MMAPTSRSESAATPPRLPARSRRERALTTRATDHHRGGRPGPSVRQIQGRWTHGWRIIGITSCSKACEERERERRARCGGGPCSGYGARPVSAPALARWQTEARFGGRYHPHLIVETL